ncbi:MAG TPA: LysM peptidoglycan-binding domain-containing protein [Salinivirga sp.]|uniref:LysM peptidoglycan-binding domain-containing protein n=1 Tax=Salinivirga sp. TaxID=1970192 RepID=UPI002B486AB1|nr:LysM peptidoglycan-binding domain-containing protein [Salinivirga sp.]HKK59881.1 LysM peptidoglycan-binding domain-containing protein [Salinivirga sp.]
MGKEHSLTIKYKSISLIGSKARHNQDAYAEFQIPGGYGFAICDGINGKEGGGAIASKMAIESIKRQFRNTQFKNPQKALTNALTLANFQLYDHIQKNERFKGMGASCVIVLVIDERVYYAYIGNVRFYILRDNTIYRLTRDHTKAQTALAQNKINEEKLESDPGFYIADRALGFDKDVNFSVCKQPISMEEHDMLLLTSDGLFKELTENQIAEVVNDPDASVDFMATNLAQKADQAGGNDNITLTLMHVFDPQKVPFTPETGEKTEIVEGKKGIPKAVWIVLGVIGLVALLYGISEIAFNHERVTTEQKPQKSVVDTQPKDTIKPARTEDLTKKKEKEPQGIKPEFIPYKIEKGDNFYRLGIRFNVTVQLLEKVNNVQAKRLRLGQRIRIPVKAIHKVEKGEMLSTIAEKYHTPVKDILKANKLDDADRLSEGMVLNIPLQYDDKISE